MKSKKKYQNTATSYNFFKKASTYYIIYFFLYLFYSEKHLYFTNEIDSVIYSSIPVSVIIPVYNKLIYLNSSMNSIQSQTLHNIEIICIDDCSTDNSTEFILNRMKTDNRIKLIKNFYNQGTCLARINGVLCSNGDYIFSYDPDDLLMPTAIKFNYELAFSLNADIIDYRIKAKSPTKIKHNYCPCRHNYSDNSGILERLKTYNINWNLCKKLIRRSIYLKAIHLILPFVENKRIIAAEDLLHCGTIFFFVNKFICSKHLSYIYFMDTPDCSGSGKNQPLVQNEYQLYYIRSIISYFLKNKDKIMSCTPEKLFATNKTVLSLYNNITNISKSTSSYNYITNYNGFHTEIFNAKGFYVISNRRFNGT